MDVRELTKVVNQLTNDMIEIKKEVSYLTQELKLLQLKVSDLQIDVKMLDGGGRNGLNRMTVYDQTRLCFKVTPHQEPGRSVIQELGIYEDIHEEEIKKARNITDIRDLYFTKGAKLDPYWENLGKPKTERSGWIPVSESLPDVGDTYIVTVEFCGNVVGVDAAIYPGKYIDMFDTLNDWVEGSPEGYHISAWMPMPEPHREVEE